MSDLGSIFAADDPEEPTKPRDDDSLYEAALAWARKGYNVVPQKAPDKKHPGVKWKDLQTRPVTEAELAQWRSMFANGVGFIPGAISGVVVIETDGPGGEALLDQFEFEHGPLSLSDTLVIRSGSGRGLHRHFKHPGHKVKTTANENIQIDVRGDGGFCVLPPSLHKSGRRYEVVHDAEPAELPLGLLDFIEKKAREADGAANGVQGEPKGKATTESAARNGPSFLDKPREHLRELGLEANTSIDMPPPPIEEMRAAVQHLAAKHYFAARDGIDQDEAGHIIAVGWRECGMALKAAYGDQVGSELWGITHIDDRARNDAPAQWASFASASRPGDVTIATIIKAAKDAGFAFGPAMQSSSADPTLNDECETALARLAGMSTVDYDRVRKAEAERLGVRVGTLDEEVARRRPKRADQDEGIAGRALDLAAPEPWQQPVDGAMLLDEMVAQIRRYVMLPREAAAAIALWIVHCHGFDLFPITPRLLIESPTPRCGKTRLVEIIERMVPRALRADNISAAAMFRVVEVCRPVVLIDEADSFLKESEDHRNIVNSGHTRGGAVVRTVGEDFEPRRFATFAPVALASIGSLATTIMDRSIVVIMRRRLASEKVDRLRSDRAGHLHELARKAARWVADHEYALRDADPDTPEALDDRVCDNWRPLLAIADLAGGGWPQAARAAAQTLSAQGIEQDGHSRGVMLLDDIRRVFDDKASSGGSDCDRVSSTGLVNALVALIDRPWATWSKGKPIAAAAVARLLRDFGIFPNTVKLSDRKQPNGYKRSQFDDAFARYLPQSPGSPAGSSPSSPTTANPGTSGQFQSSPRGASGEVSEPAQAPENQGVGEDGELSNPKTVKSEDDDDSDDLTREVFEQIMRRARHNDDVNA